jgi:hypothetical protein
MTIQDAIQKSIEGGWKKGQELHSIQAKIWFKRDYHGLNLKRGVSFSEALLDPSFWVSLGKSLGWDDPNKATAGYITYYEATGEDYWCYMWHRLIDSRRAGKSIEQFFEQL